MKLIQLEIQAFGSIRNRKFEFPEGFSLIYGENERGKSTIMTCLKALFYGFSGRNRSPLENDRLRCLPWDGSRMSVSLIFSHEGIRYRLQRSFGKTKSQDERVLMNDVSGETILLPSQQEIGPYLFHVTEPEFTHTVFVGQMNSILTEPDHSTLAKLSNLSGSLDEGLSSQAIDSRLQKAQVKLQAERGGGGLIPQMEQKLSALNEIREQSFELETIQLLRNQRLNDTVQERSELEQTKNRLESQILRLDLAQLEARLAQLVKRNQVLRDLFEEERQLAAPLTARSIDENQLASWRSELISLQQERFTVLQQLRDVADSEKTSLANLAAANWKNLADYQQRLQDLVSHPFRLDRKIEGRKSQKKERSLHLGFVPGMIGLVLASILTGILYKPVFYLVAAIVSVSCFMIYYKRLRERQLDLLREQVDEAERTARKSQETLDHWQEDKVLSGPDASASLAQTIDGLIDHWQVLQQSVNWISPTGSNCLDQDSVPVRAVLLALDPADIQNNLDQIADRLADLRHCHELRIQSEQNLLADLDGLSWESYQSLQLAKIRDGKQRLETEPSISGAFLEPAELGDMMVRLDEIKLQLAQTERDAASLESAILHSPRPEKIVADCDREIAELKAQLAQARDYYASLTLARTWVQQAFSDLQATFGPRLNQDTARILDRLTASRYASVKVDRSFSVQVAIPSDQQYHDWRYFSGGTVDQVYLALRLAIAGMIQSNSEPLPLLLDDALVQYDDLRTAAAVDYLAERAGETGGQIILLTSQARLKEIAGQVCPAIPIIDL